LKQTQTCTHPQIYSTTSAPTSIVYLIERKGRHDRKMGKEYPERVDGKSWSEKEDRKGKARTDGGKKQVEKVDRNGEVQYPP
jgi:hypothetical protein